MSTKGDASGEGLAKTTYFRYVGDEVLQLLFRFTFNGGLGLWGRENEARRKLVLMPTHPLNPAIKHVFRSLDITGETSPAIEFYLSDRFDDSLDLLKIGRDATMDEVKAAVLGMKESVKALEFSTMHWIEQDLQQICQIVTTHCRNVTELRVLDYKLMEVKETMNDSLGKVFSTYASQLTSLSCEYISEYISPPLLARSHGSRSMPLKQLSLTGDFADVEIFDLLIAQCGGTLENLELALEVVEKGQWAKILEAIRRECSKLTSLHLREPTMCGVLEEDYVAFLTSYGNQIVSLAPLKFSPDALRNLSEACPNLRLELSFEEDEANWDCLDAAGEIAGNVEIELCYHHNVRRLSRVLGACPHLVELNMSYMSDEPALGLESVISSRMLQLEKLSFRNFRFHACINNTMKCTSKLKELRITAIDIIETAVPLQTIATTATHLEFVWIQDDSKEQNLTGRPSRRARNENTTIFIEIVRCFLGCERLRSFHVLLNNPVSQDELRAVCLPLRTRGVDCLFCSQHRPLLQIHDFVYSERRDENMTDSSQSSSPR